MQTNPAVEQSKIIRWSESPCISPVGKEKVYDITASFIVVKTERSTSQQSVTQDSDMPTLSRRTATTIRSETDGAKVLPTFD